MAFLVRGGSIDGTPRKRGRIHEQTGLIPAIAALCNLVFGVGLGRLTVGTLVGSHQASRGCRGTS